MKHLLRTWFLSALLMAALVPGYAQQKRALISLAKHYAGRLLDNVVEVKSEIGMGTSFRVTLPLKRAGG